MKKTFYRWWFITTLIATGSYFAVDAGILADLLVKDVTHISMIILSIFGISTAFMGWRSWLFSFNEEYTDTKLGWFTGEVMFALGMIGTLIGFLLVFGDALSSLDMTDNISKAKVIADMSIGISTAIYTTLAGLVCTVLLWLQLVNIEYGQDHYGE